MRSSDLAKTVRLPSGLSRFEPGRRMRSASGRPSAVVSAWREGPAETQASQVEPPLGPDRAAAVTTEASPRRAGWSPPATGAPRV